jgi:hypothetical protein
MLEDKLNSEYLIKNSSSLQISYVETFDSLKNHLSFVKVFN